MNKIIDEALNDCHKIIDEALNDCHKMIDDAATLIKQLEMEWTKFGLSAYTSNRRLFFNKNRICIRCKDGTYVAWAEAPKLEKVETLELLPELKEQIDKNLMEFCSKTREIVPRILKLWNKN